MPLRHDGRDGGRPARHRLLHHAHAGVPGGACGLRLLWLFTVVPAHHTLLAVEASYPITWAVTSVAILLYYRFGRWLHPPKKA